MFAARNEVSSGLVKKKWHCGSCDDRGCSSTRSRQVLSGLIFLSFSLSLSLSCVSMAARLMGWGQKRIDRTERGCYDRYNKLRNGGFGRQ